MSADGTGASTDSRAEFVSEAGDLLERINGNLLQLASLPAGSAIPPETVNEIFRAAHSLKGLAGMFGFKNVSTLSHKLESLLDSLRLGRLPLDREALDVLFEGVERLSGLLEHRDGGAEDVAAVEELGQRIARLREDEHDIDRAAILARFDFDAAILGVLSEYEQHRLVQNLTSAGRSVLLIRAAFDLMTFDTGLLGALEKLKRLGEVIASIPDTDAVSGDSIAFKILLGTGRPLAEVEAALEAEGLRFERILPRGNGGGGPPTAPPRGGGDAAPSADAAGGSTGAAPRTFLGGPEHVGVGRAIRVDLPRLDSMMGLAGELLLSRTEISHMAEELRGGQASPTLPGELWRATQMLERRLRALEDLILDIRMVPLDRLYERMARMVRRASRDLGKEIELVTRGAETRLDKLVIEALADPIMHLIRNSIDHGIEAPTERVRRGKPETGRILLEARQQGGQVILTIADDGAGIDLSQIRAAALRRGVASENSSPAPEELFELLFLPGFSTRLEASEVSGRGVGLDVVRSHVQAIKGTIRLESEPGRGATVTLAVPMTLARIRALLVGVGDQSFALPLDAIERNYELASHQRVAATSEQVLDIDGERVPLLRLGDYLGIEHRHSLDEPEWVVVAAQGGDRVGLVVDALEGQQDVLVKDVGPLVKRIRGVAGAAEVGEGRTLLLLEPAVLLQDAARLGRTALA